MSIRKITIHDDPTQEEPYYALFLADNGEPLVRTTDHYHNLDDLTSMIAKYFPGWLVELPVKEEEP